MSRHTLLAMTFTLALVVLQPSAYAQAAAESALLGAGSSTATVKAGSALNSILNQSSKQLAGRVQRQVLQPTPETISHVGARQVPTSRVKGTPVRAGSTPTAGPVIASIQGAVTGCVPTNQTPSALGSSAPAESVQTNCGGQHSASRPVPPEYKSVITLSFPKR